jgi:ATP-dependent DNA helicase RecQ
LQQQALDILKKYWGYDGFRPGQSEIIDNISAGSDCLALLPTGGGKSICFQVPGLMHNGLTLVISPLIALIKDQVDALEKRNIPAVALHSGLSRGEIKMKLDAALNGHYKFMYISPERLVTNHFREYLPNLNVKLLVVDEAHCISQWGYDFRPAYQRIAECRSLLPDVPCAAFTASAPPYVVKDIIDKLQLRNLRTTIGDFNRSNLRFHTRNVEDKKGVILKTLSKTAGSSLVFAPTRKETEELASFLQSHGLSAAFYHAGLNADERAKRQEKWINDEIRIIVCTNAFGMGIDKPDVRFVFHTAPPQCPEDYYQEAGRAGRDGKDSWCIMLYRLFDFEELQLQLESKFPPRETIQSVYLALMNYLGVVAGGGMMQSFELDVHEMAERYKMNVTETVNALKVLELLNYIALSESFRAPSRLHFTAEYSEVYEHKIRFPKIEPYLDVVLRSYGGVFDDYVKINENVIARRLRANPDEVAAVLRELMRGGFADYQPSSDKPRVMLLEPRSPYPVFNLKQLVPLKKTRLQGIENIKSYVFSNECRANWWIQYFSGKEMAACGKCDVCLNRIKTGLKKDEIEELKDQLRVIITTNDYSVLQLFDQLPEAEVAKMRNTLRWLMDNGTVKEDSNGKLKWLKT